MTESDPVSTSFAQAERRLADSPVPSRLCRGVAVQCRDLPLDRRDGDLFETLPSVRGGEVERVSRPATGDQDGTDLHWEPRDLTPLPSSAPSPS